MTEQLSEADKQLMEAISKCEAYKVEKLIYLGADVNAKHGQYHESPLHTAAYHGFTDIVQLLLDHGAEANALDGWSKTPLHHACENNHLEVAKILIKHGAKVNSRQEDHQSPLHISCFRGFLELSEFLIQKGAEVDGVDMSGKSPLYYAAENQQASMCKMLMGHGADVNLPDHSYQEDESLIMKAVRNGTPFTVEKISPRAGLELWAHQDGLRCPCKQTGNHKVVPLCKNGGKHNSQSPLLVASTRQYSEVLKILLGDSEDEFQMPDLVDPIVL